MKYASGLSSTASAVYFPIATATFKSMGNTDTGKAILSTP